jgi:hypothetical protein
MSSAASSYPTTMRTESEQKGIVRVNKRKLCWNWISSLLKVTY